MLLASRAYSTLCGFHSHWSKTAIGRYINFIFHFQLSFSFSFLFSYIDILPWHIEHSSKIFLFLCQEILTKLFVFLRLFGTAFANANIMPKIFFMVWHKICSRPDWQASRCTTCHFGRSAYLPVILAQGGFFCFPSDGGCTPKNAGWSKHSKNSIYN
jgi:hypothetical protein